MPVRSVGGLECATVYIQTAEDEVVRLNATWDSIGVLFGARMFVEYSLVLKEKYPLIGTLDNEQIVYDTIASGDAFFEIRPGMLVLD